MKINGSVSTSVNYNKWGEIQGNIDSQTDLVNKIHEKDAYYDTLVNDEARSRIAGDANISNKLSNEAEIRAFADTDLSVQISSSAKDLEEKIIKEAEARNQQVSEVDSRLSNEVSIAIGTATEAKESVNNHILNYRIHVSEGDRKAWNAKSDFSGKYEDLEGKPEIPSRVSQLDNDKGYQTKSEIDDQLDKKADKNIVDYHILNEDIHVTKQLKDTWNNKLDRVEAASKYKKLQDLYDSNWEIISSEGTDCFISRVIQNSEGQLLAVRSKIKGQLSDYKKLTNKPKLNGIELVGDLSSTDVGINIPTKTSELFNDSGYIDNQVNTLENYYTKGLLYTQTDLYNKTDINNLLVAKQDLLQSGSGINIDQTDKVVNVKVDNFSIKVNSEGELCSVVSIKDVKVDGASVVVDNVAEIDLTEKQDKLTAGANITIDSNNVISASGSLTTAKWGSIEGNINDQNDLYNSLNLKIDKTAVSNVGKTGSYIDLINKPTIPTKTSQLTNDSGFITSTSGDIVTQVKVGNTSVVSGTVATISYPTSAMPGVVSKSGWGVNVDTGTIKIEKASNANIDAKLDEFKPIVSNNLDYAVKKALTNSTQAWSSAEKAQAQQFVTIPAKKTALGTVQIGSGLNVDTYGEVVVDVANTTEITDRTANKILDASTLDIAVKSALITDDEYAQAEQLKVRTKINAAENAKATASNLGLVRVTGDDGIYIDTNGTIYADQANQLEISNREDIATKLITTSNYDYAVKEALCSSEGGLEWTDTELLHAQKKLNISSALIIDELQGLKWDTSSSPKSLVVNVDQSTISFNSEGALKVISGGLLSGEYLRNAAIDPSDPNLLTFIQHNVDGSEETISYYPTGSSGTVTDVKVNGTSAVSSGVANIPIGKGQLGVGQFDNSTGGLQIGGSGTVSLYPATAGNMTARQYDRAITSKNFDDAVRIALTDGAGPAYTPAEQDAAKARLGITSSGGVSDVQVEGVSKVVSGVANLTTSDITNAIKYRGATNRLFGLMTTSNQMWLASAKQSEISNASLRNNLNDDDAKYRQAITQGNIDYAVKAALTDGIGTAYTAAEKQAARERLGIFTKKVGDPDPVMENGDILIVYGA